MTRRPRTRRRAVLRRLALAVCLIGAIAVCVNVWHDERLTGLDLLGIVLVLAAAWLAADD